MLNEYVDGAYLLDYSCNSIINAINWRSTVQGIDIAHIFINLHMKIISIGKLMIF